MKEMRGHKDYDADFEAYVDEFALSMPEREAPAYPHNHVVVMSDKKSQSSAKSNKSSKKSSSDGDKSSGQDAENAITDIDVCVDEQECVGNDLFDAHQECYGLQSCMTANIDQSNME